MTDTSVGGSAYSITDDSTDKTTEKDPLVDESDMPKKGADDPGGGGPPLDLFQIKYIGIVFNYFSIGFTPAFMSNPMTIYMVNTLNAGPAAQNTVGMLLTLPWCFKVLYGFLSDAYPFLGYRRKTYLMLGNAIAVVVLVVLATCVATDLMTITLLGWLVFLQTAGMILSDVMSDAYCVELSKQFAHTTETGRIQGLAYGTRFAAAIIGSCCGTFLYNKVEWGWGLSFHTIAIICAAFQCISFPALMLLDERPAAEIVPAPEPIGKQMANIWDRVQLQAVWQPMLYIYFYNVMQIPNAAWNSFLLKGLNFTPFEMGILSLVGNIMTFGGFTIYNKFLFKASWRYIYVVTTVLGLVFSCLQLVLVYRVNLKVGINDFAFSFGDNVFAAFVGGIQFLPTVIMMVGMCPVNQEGATFAMFTTFSNLAMAVGSVFGNFAVANFWDCSNAAMEKGDFTGLAKLTLLTSLLQVVPVLFVRNLPDSEEEQKQLQGQSEKSCPHGGLFMFLLVASLLTAVGNAIYELH